MSEYPKCAACGAIDWYLPEFDHSIFGRKAKPLSRLCFDCGCFHFICERHYNLSLSLGILNVQYDGGRLELAAKFLICPTTENFESIAKSKEFKTAIELMK